MSSVADDLGALAPIVERKVAEVERLRCGAAALWAAVGGAPPPRDFAGRLRDGAVVAELKRRSPSGGELRPHLDCTELASRFAAAGAAALSVLTDAVAFGGSLEDLVAARAACSLPVLRKDFVVDPLQVAEARVAGADAVLLIVAVLGREGLESCLEAAHRVGIDALVEVHDAAELEVALEAGVSVVGINNRDLRRLTTDLETFERLRPLVPASVRVVAESGITGPDDAVRLRRAGADALLVGEVLMRASDPGGACATLVTAVRGASG